MITPVAIAAHEPLLIDNSLDWFGMLPLFILAELFVFTVYILIPCALHEPVCDFFMCRCLLDIYIGLQNCGIRILNYIGLQNCSISDLKVSCIFNIFFF